MATQRDRTRFGVATFVLWLLLVPPAAMAQQAKVSLRVAPLGALSTSPLFTVQIVDSPSRRGGMKLPSFTVTDTSSGPQLTNLALALPVMNINRTPVSSRLGDQKLPSMFLASPLSGSLVHAPMRGLSFSMTGATPWTFSMGQLDTASYTGDPASVSPSVVALATTLAPFQRLSVAPRLLVPVRSRAAWNTSIGTAVRADLIPHLALVSDVGAADAANGGWAPLASGGVVGHWAATEVETSIVRGAPALDTWESATVGSLDRELARGLVQPVPGVTLSGLVARSRPASAARASDTTSGSVGVVVDRLPFGRLAATREHQLTQSQTLTTTRLEWRHRPTNFTIRYTETDDGADRDGSDRGSRLVELDLPKLTPQVDGRVNFRAALAANADSTGPGMSSRVSGRFDLASDVALIGETELDLVRRGERQLVRAMRFGTDVEVLQDTALQLQYAYREGVPFSFGRAFEVRISRAINLGAW